jgi:hypothetical protein
MDTPKNLPEKQTSVEAAEGMQERIETLEGISKEFNEQILPAIRAHENVASVVFDKKKGYDEDQKNGALINLVAKLGSFQDRLMATHKLFAPESSGIRGIGGILAAVQDLKKCLAAAPDIRYSREEQIKKYEGEENIPGGKSVDTWEYTKKAMDTLQSIMSGVSTATSFIKLEKYN